MNILLISPTPPPNGGIATWTNEYIECLSKKDNIFLVNTKLNGARVSNINSSIGLVDEIKRTIRIIFEVKSQINKSIDISHINSSCSIFGIIRDMFIVKILKRKKIPIIFHCHCNVEDQIKYTLQKIILKKICKNSNLIIVLNSKSLNYVSLITNTRVTMIPNFINSNDNVRVSINNTINQIIYVGHVKESKGSDMIVELAKLFPDINFKLIGPVHEKIEELAIPNNVSITGELKHDNVCGELLKSDIFIFPSKTEGFSISLLEAMKVGLPCVVSDVGANKDMIEGEGGYVVKNNDINSFYNAIKCLEQKEIREQCSDWNVEKVRKSYTREKVLNEIKKEYDKIIRL